MRILLQRVSRASVTVEGERIAEIGAGLLLLVGIGAEDVDDDGAAFEPMAAKLINLRIHADEKGLMNRSLQDAGGAVLAVSQFTLHADCRKGRRPGFSNAAPPEIASEMFDRFVAILRASGLDVQTGRFGAMMDVELVNDGPVTIWLDSEEIVKR